METKNRDTKVGLLTLCLLCKLFFSFAQQPTLNPNMPSVLNVIHQQEILFTDQNRDSVFAANKGKAFYLFKYVSPKIKQSQNATTITTEQYEQNEKIVNEIYLATVGKEIYELSQIQQSQLLGIAYQCPLAGGRAVYLARSLYGMYSDSIAWEDDSLCVAAGMNFRQSNPSNNTIKIPQSEITFYPNPANEEITILFSQETESPYIVSISDMLGKQVILTTIPSNLLTYQLDVSRLLSGIYVVKIKDKGQIRSTNKLIINK